MAVAMESEPEHFASSGPIEKNRAYFDSVTQSELDKVNTSHCELIPLGNNWGVFVLVCYQSKVAAEKNVGQHLAEAFQDKDKMKAV